MAKKFSIGKSRTVAVIEAPKNPVGRPKKVQAVVEVPVEVTRGRGRPRKIETPIIVETAEKSVTTNGVQRQKRIGDKQLLQSDMESGRIPLASQKVIDQFQALLGRAEVQEFRGRKVKPGIIISTMEQQALQEALTLYEAKLTLQRGGQLRRVASK